MATENNEAVRAGEGARSATALGGLIKRDWINDHYRTIAWWVGLLLFIFIPVVKMLLDNAAVKASAWQRPDLVPGSQPYLDYLQSTPWIYVAVSMLTIAVLYGICWAFGARFFGPRRFDAHFFRWVAIGLVGTAIIQLITKIPEWVGWDLGEIANQASINESLAVMTWPKIILMYVVFPALTEELVDRGLLQRYVLSKWPLVGVVVSALAFASIHFTTNWFHFAMFALSGLNFAYIYHRTGRLEVSITVHAIGNLLILVWIMATL